MSSGPRRSTSGTRVEGWIARLPACRSPRPGYWAAPAAGPGGLAVQHAELGDAADAVPRAQGDQLLGPRRLAPSRRPPGDDPVDPRPTVVVHPIDHPGAVVLESGRPTARPVYSRAQILQGQRLDGRWHSGMVALRRVVVGRDAEVPAGDHGVGHHKPRFRSSVSHTGRVRAGS